MIGTRTASLRSPDELEVRVGPEAIAGRSAGSRTSASAKLSLPTAEERSRRLALGPICSSNSENMTTAAAPASSRRLMLSRSCESGEAEATSGCASFRPR